ncbi:hypothetical protein Gogos_022188 [Gossypium gossypioides]|uniref:Uncharacterized protein n=1 Tax=Gossypium gossypioides TaxID=34282 RepID=A0A7J9D1I6_GOSGO|nr:hypothetical protein [Gossypium gossypioides]
MMSMISSMMDCSLCRSSSKCVLDNVEKLTGRDDAIEAMMMALKEEIAELKGELTIYNAVLGNGGLVAVAPKPSVDVPKPKKFKGTRKPWDKRKSGPIS